MIRNTSTIFSYPIFCYILELLVINYFINSGTELLKLKLQKIMENDRENDAFDATNFKFVNVITLPIFERSLRIATKLQLYL